jgi:KUP system potassium uptake protein
MPALALGALGVVYGDIGTSPLYAIRECFQPAHHLPATEANVLGILSLVFWSLVLIVSIKYLVFVLRADNHGEGGILALLALAIPSESAGGHRRRNALIALGLFGAALLGADGTITPAISVLSAVEGLEVATHALEKYIVPITLFILLLLFLVQRRGTGRIGSIFGPAMLIWFVTIAALGLHWVIREPHVLIAINPYYGIHFFIEHGWKGFLILGAVVLCITGTEALYADLGHFGRTPIRIAWYALVFPSLLLNYFGQGAVILARGQAVVSNPFYNLAPDWFLYPLVVIATAATVIASQALISGAFSLAQQAVQMGYSPRVTIVHTSSEERGQIYVPEINLALALACCGLVLAFRNSTGLAAAYGVSVMGTMSITSILLFVVMHRVWKWPLWLAGGATALFLGADLTFFASNLSKVWHGGWFPLLLGAIIYTLMATWKQGRRMLADAIRAVTLPLDTFMKSLSQGHQPVRVPGTAIFMTSNPKGTPIVLLHHYKHNKVLHERVILLCVVSQEVPEIPSSQRVHIRDLGHGFFEVVAQYGFMQTPQMRDILHRCGAEGLKVDARETSFYLGRETLIISDRPGMARWRKVLFSLLSRNARPATAYFGLPPGRVVELGAQIEL